MRNFSSGHFCYALDFDGVICDSATETAATAWRAAAQFWPRQFSGQVPDAMIQSFRAVRPFLETGFQAIPMIKMLRDEMPNSAFVQHLSENVDQIMTELGLDKHSMVQAFGNTRDQWINDNLPEWLAWNRLYDGVKPALLQALAAQTPIRILTTKQERFTKAILEAHGIELSEEYIWGLERQEKKETQLARLLSENDWQVRFLEDRLETLKRVEACESLNQVELFFADWGYGTDVDLSYATSSQRVKVLSLNDFPGFLNQG